MRWTRRGSTGCSHLRGLGAEVSDEGRGEALPRMKDFSNFKKHKQVI